MLLKNWGMTMTADIAGSSVSLTISILTMRHASIAIFARLSLPSLTPCFVTGSSASSALFVPSHWGGQQSTSSRLFSSSTPSSMSPPTTRYVLSYDYVPDVLEKRGPHREGHLGLASLMIQEGACVSGGPTLVPGESVPKGAIFVFKTKDAAEKFITEDPYVSNGIVVSHTISEWNVLLGTN